MSLQSGTMLPQLPKKNNKKEAEFGTKFVKWFWTQKFPRCDFELKDTNGKDYLNFSEVKEEQVNSALRSASDRGNLVRVIHGTTGTSDYSYKRNDITYIVIRYPKSCEVIPINNFLFEKEHSKRKSLTSARAKAISVMSF